MRFVITVTKVRERKIFKKKAATCLANNANCVIVLLDRCDWVMRAADIMIDGPRETNCAYRLY